MKYNIPVFRSEINDGLSDIIQQHNSIAYLSPLSSVNPEASIAKSMYQKAVATNDGQFDLFYMKDILVSTGWNKNADVFDRVQTWNARGSAVDKAFNFEHNPLDIIGHITSAEVVDCDMNVIADDTPVDELPDKFHIVTGSVIYRYIGDEDRDALIEKTIAEIINGEWFVSMECLFQGFDYAVIDEQGNHGVIERNSASAFLTKYLIPYGGTGKFVDKATGSEYTLGRLMQIKAFSGKGLVRKPGNADSVILTTHAFEPAQASLVYNLVDHSVAEQAQNLETKTMAETNDALKPIQDELAAAKAEIKSLSEKLQANASQNYETTIAGLKADIVAKDAQISNLTEQVATVTASHTEVAEKLTTVTASLTEKSTELEAANAELAKVVVEKTKAARIAAMIEKGAASDKAASLAEKFASFSEEQFTETVEVLAAAWAAAAAAPAVEEKPTAAAVISDVVETAKASQQNVNLAAVPSVEKPEVRKSTANFFKGFLRTAVSGDEASLDSE